MTDPRLGEADSLWSRMDQARILSFDNFRVDISNQQLWRGSELVEIRLKTLQVLIYLASHPQRLVTRQELLDNLWMDARGSAGLLRSYVWELRRLLGDSASSPRLLKTVSRRGYRFLQPVEVKDVANFVDALGSAGAHTEHPAEPARSVLQVERAAAAVPKKAEPPILVGVLHSLSGTMAYSESPVVDATLMAIDEINQRGGLLGRRIEAEVADGHSSGAEFARKAQWLLTERGARNLFGCWMSAHRRRVVPLVENHDGILIYPVQYEGLETSPCVFYIGAAPNQQIIPGVQWAFGFLNCKRLFLVGSDYIFPLVANEIIRDQVKRLGGSIVGEAYFPPGAVDMGSIASEIAAAKPDLIVNTINGDSNIVFFRALRREGITPARIPTLSFSIGENELCNLDIAGTYAAWNYFQSIHGTENLRFIAAIRSRYGSRRVTSDPMEAAYLGVHLWAQAVSQAGSVDPTKVRSALRQQSLEAPEGLVKIDCDNQHSWKTVRIGRVNDDGQFDVIYSSENPVRPQPYPDTRSLQEWRKFLAHLPSSVTAA